MPERATALELRTNPPASPYFYLTALLDSVLNLGDGFAGARLVESTARGTAHANCADRLSTSPNHHSAHSIGHVRQRVCGIVVGAALAIRSATSFVLPSFRPSVNDADE